MLLAKQQTGAPQLGYTYLRNPKIPIRRMRFWVRFSVRIAGQKKPKSNQLISFRVDQDMKVVIGERTTWKSVICKRRLGLRVGKVSQVLYSRSFKNALKLCSMAKIKVVNSNNVTSA